MRRAAHLALAAALAWAAPVSAQVADPALTERAGELVGVLAGRDAPDYFAPVFTDAIPPAQLAAVEAQLRAALGAPQRVEALTPASPYAARLTVAYERGTAAVELVIDPAPSHRVIGLRITGTTLRDDSFARLTADFRALPGASGFGVYALGTGEPRALAEWRGEAGAPLGSAFKLWLLAETSRQVSAGQRRWSDVVPLGPPSLPSGITQSWPTGTPMTLQTLATLAISISDNTAADTLLHLLGRERVEAAVRATGIADPARDLPFLGTREAFVIKGDPALTQAWARAGMAERRQLLTNYRFGEATLSASIFADHPVASETVEWFASPLDMARTLDWLRLHGDATARAVLAINPGTDAATAARFGYVGFKGGSEPGVVTLNYLVRTRAGRWLAVTGNWHRADADTPVLSFATLMNRALALAASADAAAR